MKEKFVFFIWEKAVFLEGKKQSENIQFL